MQNGVPLSRRQGYPRGTPVARTGVPRFGTFNGNHCRNTGKELGGPFANTETRANGGLQTPEYLRGKWLSPKAIRAFPDSDPWV